MSFTRRELLERCAAFGAISLATSIPLSSIAYAWDEAEKKIPTPTCELGPFYKRQAPHTSLLRAPGDTGMPLALSGTIYDLRGEVGEKPPHQLVWNLTTNKSTPVQIDFRPTCGNVVDGKPWLCNSDGKTLTITQRE